VAKRFVCVSLGILCLVAAYQLEVESAVAPLTRSWERAIPMQDTPDGLSSLRAAECGECHTTIYEEWKTSAHAQALADPQFQGNR
jgi:hypothetical protein